MTNVKILLDIADLKRHFKSYNRDLYYYTKSTYNWVKPEQASERIFDRFVELHEADVGTVPEEEDEGFPPTINLMNVL